MITRSLSSCKPDTLEKPMYGKPALNCAFCCLYIVRSKVDGFVMLQVDDLMGARDTSVKSDSRGTQPFYQHQSRLQVSNHLSEDHTQYCGADVCQRSPLGAVEIKFETYTQKLKPVTCDKQALDRLDPKELRTFRGMCGALPWHATQATPALSCRASRQQSEDAHPMASSADDADEALRFRWSQCLYVASTHDLVFVCFSDGTSSVRHDSGSQRGHLIAASHLLRVDRRRVSQRHRRLDIPSPAQRVSQQSAL